MPTEDLGQPAPSFTAAELENSAPFDTDKRLRGEAGKSLEAEVLALLDAKERATSSRKRARKTTDVELRRQTVGIFLANLVALWLNRVDATRFLAISFSSNAYSGLPVSLKTLIELRDQLEAEGLVSVAPGFLKVDQWDEFAVRHGRLTRIRATPSLIEIFERHEIERPSVKHVTERGVIHVTDRNTDIGPEPDDVASSREVLARLNARLAASAIELPEDAWARLRADRGGAAKESGESANGGDETAKALRRIFKHHWGRGGRIYGGWWMHLPKAERCNLTIDTESVVELDYSRLHPTMLFARVGIELDFDPYVVPHINHPQLRDLGKSTFQRLLNRTSQRNGMDVSMRAAPGDAELLPGRMTFKAYLNLFKRRLEPIASWFGTGVGVELQREDSNLAVEVLRRMSDVGALVLPIHDSFIVKSKYEDELRETMGAIFRDRYGFYPGINKVG